MRLLFLTPFLFLCACGGSDDETPNSGPFTGGLYYGLLKTGSGGPFVNGEAILSLDGGVRIELGDFTDLDVPVLVQIVGHVNPSAPTAWMPATMIGETCAASAEGWGCGVAQPLEIRFTRYGDPHVVMELRGTLSLGSGTFELPMEAIAEGGSADLSRDQGIYALHAGFAGDAGENLVVDESGALFFQSGATGCTGNGGLTPYGGGSDGLYSVELTIGNCSSDFAYLNRVLSGLAAYHGPALFETNAGLVFMLSTFAEEANPAAVRMWGERF